MYTTLRLPHGLDGEINGFDFAQADNSAEFLISLLEELRVESEETKQFQIFSEKLLLEAWRDGRLFGLSMEVTENMLFRLLLTFCNLRRAKKGTEN